MWILQPNEVLRGGISEYGFHWETCLSTLTNKISRHTSDKGSDTSDKESPVSLHPPPSEYRWGIWNRQNHLKERLDQAQACALYYPPPPFWGLFA